MAGASAIEWTDATWNPVTGCDRVSPGCAHCYALTLAKRLKRMGQPGYQRDGDPRTSGPGFGVTLHPEKLGEPLRWRKPRRVFVNSMSDLFHDEIPDRFIARVFTVMSSARAHTFQVLTKRPERALAWFEQHRPADWYAGPWPLTNVWLGVSIENARYTWRADVLRQIPAAVRFISAEPLLGSLFDVASARPQGAGLSRASGAGCGEPTERRKAPLDLTGIDWVIVGGESGPGARPMHPDWARELRDACLSQCAECAPASVRDLVSSCDRRTAFFFKQWGEWCPDRNGAFEPETIAIYPDGRRLSARNTAEEWLKTTSLKRVGKKRAGRELDGRTWDELPVLS